MNKKLHVRIIMSCGHHTDITDCQMEQSDSRDTYNFGIGNSICKHGLKFCGSLLDYFGGAMINLCGSLLDLWISTSRLCVALLQF